MLSIKNLPNMRHFSFHSLAVCDVGLIMDMMVQKYVTYYLDNQLWYSLSFPYFWHPMKGILLSASIFIIIAVSAERFRAICYPFTKRQVSRIIL